jgi:hypothetical protein
LTPNPFVGRPQKPQIFFPTQTHTITTELFLVSLLERNFANITAASKLGSFPALFFFRLFSRHQPGFIQNDNSQFGTTPFPSLSICQAGYFAMSPLLGSGVGDEEESRPSCSLV